MKSKTIDKNIKKENKEESKKEKKIPKEISQEILKKIFKNLIFAVGIMLYFVVLNMAYENMKEERLLGDIQVFAGAFLVAGIIFFERAYKLDKGSLAITAIELTCLSFHSLAIMHISSLYKYDFRVYLLTSSYIIAIYFVLKSIILYTKGRREYLRSLSDISEIIKEEPVKKEAKKKNAELEESKEKKETEGQNKTDKEEKKTPKPKTVKRGAKKKKETKKNTTKKEEPKNKKMKKEVKSDD